MFSDRVGHNLMRNRLTRAVEAMRAAHQPYIDLTESNPTRAGFHYPSDLLQPLAQARALVYEPSPLGILEAREAIAREYARRDIRVAADRIVLTASTSEAYSILFKLVAGAGDEVLVPKPSYPLFDHLTRLDLVEPKPYDLEYHGTWSIDFASVERALSPRTRAVLVVSPNNPTGSFITDRELERLASLAADRGIAIIADEVFADYPLEPGAVDCAARAACRTDALTFALGGLSKSVGLPQVKLAWIAVGGADRLTSDALDRLELICDTYLSVSTPVQLAARALLDRGAAVRVQIASRVAANYHYLKASTGSTSACTVLRSEGGWYGVMQVPSIQSEEDLVLALLQTDGVLTHPGYFFDFPRESFVIVSLLPPEPTFAEGIDRVLRHFACSVTRQ
jgi:aspartate/methionine/tyrosine aminotransferase